MSRKYRPGPNIHPWTNAKYRKVLEHYNLSQAQAADMLGVTTRSSQRWSIEAPPFMVCLIFQLMHEHDYLPDDIVELSRKRGLR